SFGFAPGWSATLTLRDLDRSSFTTTQGQVGGSAALGRSPLIPLQSLVASGKLAPCRLARTYRTSMSASAMMRKSIFVPWFHNIRNREYNRLYA
ncbi:MAG: hypothetical protein WCF17_06525, partial [Terracidiphilus sp.]